jgi:hypothetical protein
VERQLVGMKGSFQNPDFSAPRFTTLHLRSNGPKRSRLTTLHLRSNGPKYNDVDGLVGLHAAAL